jgi:hypothetical protein
MNRTMVDTRFGATRLTLLVLTAVLAVLTLVPADAEAQFLDLYHSYRWNYVARHMEFGMAHSVMTDRVVFDEWGYIDLALTDLHPMAVRDLFPYPWLYRDDQLREMNFNPILFWSVPHYLPSYDEMRRIYTLGGGYFFDPWFNFYGGFWERAWAGMYGRFPYDTYWGYWYYNFYFVDYPYGGWWLNGHQAMDQLSEHVDTVQVQRKAGWPVGVWVREPLPAALGSTDLSGMSVMQTLVTMGEWNGLVMTDEDPAAVQLKKDRMPWITSAYRDFLPSPGPDREGRRSTVSDVSQGSSSSSGSLGSSTSSGGGSKKKSKKK